MARLRVRVSDWSHGAWRIWKEELSGGFICPGGNLGTSRYLIALW